ncbi:MAG TPA: YceI family protein [Candidatus Omnitrophota bacterium]|nr:YceI family protein [Candidatus Omnitrophota bacterium]
MRKKIYIFFLTFIIFSSAAFAQEKYLIDSQQSTLICSVSRMALTTVKGHFKDFSGEIIFNPKTFTDKEERILTKSSVVIKIKTSSIFTGSSFIDRKIKSKPLLDSEQYPEIIFKSQKVEVKKGTLYVHGVLSLRGIQKEIVFPFYLEEPFVNEKNQKIIRAKGKWLINRKDFKVIWNPILDKGGVIIGDIVTIDWEVVARQQEEKKSTSQKHTSIKKSSKKKGR